MIRVAGLGVAGWRGRNRHHFIDPGRQVVEDVVAVGIGRRGNASIDGAPTCRRRSSRTKLDRDARDADFLGDPCTPSPSTSTQTWSPMAPVGRWSGCWSRWGAPVVAEVGGQVFLAGGQDDLGGVIQGAVLIIGLVQAGWRGDLDVVGAGASGR